MVAWKRPDRTPVVRVIGTRAATTVSAAGAPTERRGVPMAARSRPIGDDGWLGKIGAED